MICHCDDGSDYAIKETDVDPATGATVYTAHNEHFCYRLGGMVGLSVPAFQQVDTGGDVWFGSRWETGNVVHNFPHGIADLLASNALDQKDSLPILAKMYAFDLFVNNVDRHLTNYIVRQQHYGLSVISFDFSRAWTFCGFPLPSLPMAPNELTVRAQRQISAACGSFINNSSTDAVLENIDKISESKIASILDEEPANWLTQPLKDAILNWWKSSDFGDRLDNIRVGIGNGSYL